MTEVYEDNNFIISYSKDLENIVNMFIGYYKSNINELLGRFYLEGINKLDIRLFSDKKLLINVPYKIGDFAGFFDNRGVNCYININGKKSDIDIVKAIMHEIVHYIYRYYIEEDINNRIIWFDEGLAMNYFLQNDKYMDDDCFIDFLNNKIFCISDIPCINDLSHDSSFVNDKYNGYDLSYLVVRYLIENNSYEDFYKIMKSKKIIRNIGSNILRNVIMYYKSKYTNVLIK